MYILHLPNRYLAMQIILARWIFQDYDMTLHLIETFSP